jgi:xanthine dehydrogenase accessory factor
MAMDNVDVQVLRQVLAWQDSGQQVVLGTLTRTWGSAPRPVGSLVAIREDGAVAGSVSGGCIEDDLMARMRQGLATLQRPELLRYGVGPDEARRWGLPCGGTLEVLLERVQPHSALQEVWAALNGGKRVCRELNLLTGQAQVRPAEPGDELRLSDTTLRAVHGPAWRLLIIGAGQLSHYLANMAQALNYEVWVCDPREEYAHTLQVDGLHWVSGMPDDAVHALQPDAHTAIVALTHDPKLDDLALIEALRSPAFYVGAIGSQANQARRRERLAEHFGLKPGELARLHGPVGLDIGAKTPPEIAISVLAEMTLERRGRRSERQGLAAAADAPVCGTQFST